MNVDLERQDIVNLLAALNALQVSGKNKTTTQEVQYDYD
jgi:hypothetical protein